MNRIRNNVENIIFADKPPGIKRGRGRPRKSSNNSQNPDDLHGTDEEDDEFEEVIETEQEATNLLIQGERIKMEEGKSMHPNLMASGIIVWLSCPQDLSIWPRAYR